MREVCTSSYWSKIKLSPRSLALFASCISLAHSTARLFTRDPSRPIYSQPYLTSMVKILSIQVLAVEPHNPGVPAVAVAAASDLSSFSFYQRSSYVSFAIILQLNRKRGKG